MATAAKAATHIFLSPSRFRDLVDEGVITRQASRGYDFDTVRREYITHAQKIMSGRGADGGAALSTQRAKLAEAQTVAAEIKNAISRGDFVSLTLMKSALMSTFAAMREQCLTLPGSVADALTPFSPKDRTQIMDIIRDKIHELLEGLSEANIGVGRSSATRSARDGDDARIGEGA